jgi:tRNA(fMet)-specific endonuclease VapC
MKIAIDTNRYTDLCRGNAAVVHFLEQAASIFVPVVVVAELRAGFAVGNRTSENERILHQFLQKPGVQILSPDQNTTRYYASLYRQLRSQATPIPTNDLWIAANRNSAWFGPV